MNRIALVLASLALACTVGPEFIGDSADDSTGADTSDDTTSHCGDSCGELQWTVPLAGVPACLRFDATGNAQVVIDNFGDPSYPTAVHVLDVEGTELGTPLEIPRAQSSEMWDCVGSNDGFALLLHAPSVTTEIALVPGDLVGTPTSFAPALDEGTAQSLAVVADGSLRVGGIASELGVSIVSAFAADGTLAWSWTDQTPTPTPIGHTSLAEGLGTDDILVWSTPESPPTFAQLVHLDGAGEELARAVLPVPAIWIAFATRSEDGWLIAGTETETGGIFLARLDAQLGVGAHVLDPTAAPGDQIAAVRLVRTDDGATLISSGLFEGVSLYQVRRYDHDLALVSITDVTSPHPDARFDVMEDARVGPDGAVYLAMASEIGTPGASNSVGWLARVVP